MLYVIICNFNREFIRDTYRYFRVQRLFLAFGSGTEFFFVERRALPIVGLGYRTELSRVRRWRAGRGETSGKSARLMGAFLWDVIKLNLENSNFRLFGPEENNSKR